MKISKYLLTLFIVVLTFSCADVLDEQPNDVVAETTFWQTSTDAEAGLVACYDALRAENDHTAFSWERWAMFDMLTPMGTVRNGRIRGLSTSTISPGDLNIERPWRAHYRGLVRTNDFVNRIDEIPFADEERKNSLIGEGRFLRAMYSFALTMVWGDVPFFDRVPDLSDIEVDKTSSADIIAQIKEDLAIAVDKLPDTPNDAGRAGKGAAHMLRLKLALYEEDWGAAVSSAEAIMDLGIYDLEPDYAGIFTLSNENNSEVIFDVQAIADSDIEPGNTFERMFSGRFSSNNGWSWMNPGLWLIDKYEVIDPNPDYVQEDPRIPTALYDYFEGRDPRMDANIIRPGAHFTGKGGTDFLYPFVNNYTHSRTGLHARKYVITGDDSRNGTGASPMNFIIFRYADALLHWAEAKVRQNPGAALGDQGVIDAINRIRERASDQLPLHTVGTFVNIDELLAAIYDERVRELAMEGWLYWDFKRWGWIEDRDGFDVMGIVSLDSVWFSSSPSVTQVWIPGKDEYFPIPQADLDLNPGLGQNPGW